MTSPLASLGPDTRNQVLQFLPLSDCLIYGQVSRQSLLDFLPNLKQRRERQFGVRHACQRKNPTRLVPLKDIPSLEYVSDEHQELVQPLPQDDDESNEENTWCILPSVAERIEGLYRALPSSYSRKDLARELLLGVQEYLSAEEKCQDDGNDDNSSVDTSSNLQSAITQLQSLLKAHKLHDMLLAKATIHCRPIPSNSDPSLHNNNESLSVALHQYMGDVLIAYYLMGHAIAGLVEGPLSSPRDYYSQWTQQLTSNLTEESPSHGYQQWIFLHSTLLRTVPMKPEWPTQMKLHPLCGTRGQVQRFELNPDHIPTTTTIPLEFLQSPTPFLEITDTFQVFTALVGPLHASSHHWAHSTRCNDFGPLGPAFRGRDRVRVWQQTPGRLLRHLGMFAAFYRATSSRLTSATIQDWPGLFELWLERSSAETEWMLGLSKECYRNRPMTVQPPTVTIFARME